MEAKLEPESEQAIAQRRRHKTRAILVEMTCAVLFSASIFAAKNLADSAATLLVQLSAVGLPALSFSIWWFFSARRVIKLEEFERTLAIHSFALASAIVFWLGTIWGLAALLAGLPVLPIAFIAPLQTAIWQSVWLMMSARYA